MGTVYFVVSERPVDGFDPVEAVPDGKSVARASECLDALAVAVGVRPLSEFFIMAPDEAAGFGGWVAPEDREPGMPYPEFGDEEPPGPDQYPSEAWFAAADGLTTVRALLAAVEADPAALDVSSRRKCLATSPADVVGDLRDIETALARLDAAGVRWHLAIDV